MAFIDYSPRYVKRDDDGYITEVAVRFRTGTYQMVSHLNPLTKAVTQESQYVPTTKLSVASFSALSSFSLATVSDDANCFLFTQKQFGKIKTDAELWKYLNGILKLNSTVTPIPDQT
jgi:hypothetical protein